MKPASESTKIWKFSLLQYVTCKGLSAKQSVSLTYLGCSAKSWRLVVVWWVNNTTAATQQTDRHIRHTIQ